MAIPQLKGERTSVVLDRDLMSWLWKEKRRRERSMSWIINNAMRQYMDRTEKNLAKNRDSSDIGKEG